MSTDNGKANQLAAWREALTRAGVRLTPQREAILEYLAQARTHPTAAEVYQAVRERAPHIARATVYNTLNLLPRLGLIVELRRQDGNVRYETNLTPHVNLICVRCGRVFDLDMPLSLDLPEEIPFAVRHVQVDAYGICASCATSSASDVTDLDGGYMPIKPVEVSTRRFSPPFCY